MERLSDYIPRPTLQSERIAELGEDEFVSSCPACGNPIDYCQGHGEIGDPAGAAILEAHDEGRHRDCHPDGCDEAPGRSREAWGPYAT